MIQNKHKCNMKQNKNKCNMKQNKHKYSMKQNKNECNMKWFDATYTRCLSVYTEPKFGHHHSCRCRSMVIEHQQLTRWWNILQCHYNVVNFLHYCDVIMGAVASQITSLMIVYLTVYSDADQSKHQSYTSLAFVRGIHWGPLNSPQKWPVTRKCFHLMRSSCQLTQNKHP